MKNTQFEYTRCPRCGGKIYLDNDHYGWYVQCLQCGYLRNVENVSMESIQNGKAAGLGLKERDYESDIVFYKTEKEGSGLTGDTPSSCTVDGLR